jgi:hypothetical protein
MSVSVSPLEGTPIEPERSESFDVGVGQEPEPTALVRGPNARRGEDTPLRIEPERGKIACDVVEPSDWNNEGAVLHEDDSRSHVSDDPLCIGPEVAIVVKTQLGPGRRERLAGEAGSDEIHSATPRSAVEGREIVPHRSWIQGLVLHPSHENGRREGFPLNSSHGSYVDAGKPEGELPTSSSVAQMDGTYSQLTSPPLRTGSRHRR